MNARIAPMPRMDEIESLTGEFAKSREALSLQLQNLRAEQEACKRQRMHWIRQALIRFKTAHENLKNAVQGSADIFQSPKTRMLHGIKVGFMKQRGKLEIDDPDKTVKLIRKHLPDLADVLINVKEVPARSTLITVTASDLKRIGVRVTDDVDAVVIKPADSELDKLIDALLNDDELEEVR